MYLIKKNAILLCLIVLHDYALSQEMKIEFDHLNSVNGLSQNNALITFQDKKGFIWIGTEDGLNLYDGTECKIYRNNPNDLNSLGSNFIRSIAEDEAGNLWIGTQEGLNRYNLETDNFTRFLSNSEDSGTIVSNNIYGTYLDSRKQLWISTEKGISIYNTLTHEMNLIQHEEGNSNSLPSNIVRSVIEDKKGNIWIATSGGLFTFSPDNKSFTNYTSDPMNKTGISSNNVQCVFIDSKNMIWAGTFDNGLNLLINQKKGLFRRFTANADNPKALPNNQINTISENREGVIYIGTSDGLCYFDEANDNFINLPREIRNDKNLGSMEIADVFFDNTDRMWVGTRGGGLNIYDPGINKFIHYKNDKSDINSLKGEIVTSFTEDDKGNLWVGVDGGGLNYLDRKTNKFTHITASPGGLTNNKILALCFDSKGMLWIGMWDGGVNIYNPQTKKFRHFKNDPEDNTSLCGNNIFYIFEDRKKDIWICTWGNDGICRYNYDKDNFTQFRNKPSDSSSISISGSVMVMEDDNGNLWIPSEGAGLNMYDRQKNTFMHYTVVTEKGNEHKGLSSVSVYCVFEDSKKRIWIGTNGGGLNLLDREKETFTWIGMADGLPNEIVFGILEDDYGNLWISTNNGICKFNPDKHTFKNYSVFDGLQGNQFNRWAFKKLKSGEMLFGGLNGFNLINPENVRENTFIPPVYITKFKLFNQKVEINENAVVKKNMILQDEIVLNHTQNYFSFEFIALNYRHSEKNQYKYLLEGFNDDWIYLDTKREASFTNLNPGKYTLRVTGSNDDGMWNEKGTSIKLTVLPAWYNTWLFRISTLIALIFFGRYYIVLRNRRQNEVKFLLENKIKEGEKALKEKIDEVNLKQKSLEEKELAEKETNWLNKGMFIMGQLISKNNDDINKLGQNVISELVNYIEADLGALYVINGDDGENFNFELKGCYGTDRKKVQKKLFSGEGYLGACYNDKKTILVNNLPENYSVLESGLGRISLKNMLLAPLIHNDKVNGIIELTSVNPLPAYKVKFVENLADILASSIEIYNVNEKMKKLVTQMNSSVSG